MSKQSTRAHIGAVITKMAAKGHGGARPGAGAKPKPDSFKAYIVVRCHAEQRDYFNSNMGADWLRKTVDRKRRTGK